MKRIAFILIGLLFVALTFAQTSGTTYTLAPNVTSYSAFQKTHTGDWAAAELKDSIGGTASKYWIFAINRSKLYFYTILFEYDTVCTVNRTTGNTVYAYAQGSIDGTHFVTIDSTTLKPTASYLPPAQLVSPTKQAALADVSTGVLWKYIRVYFTGATANECAIISKLAIKIGERY
jgi:hypothetical protein